MFIIIIIMKRLFRYLTFNTTSITHRSSSYALNENYTFLSTQILKFLNDCLLGCAAQHAANRRRYHSSFVSRICLWLVAKSTQPAFIALPNTVFPVSPCSSMHTACVDFVNRNFACVNIWLYFFLSFFCFC